VSEDDVLVFQITGVQDSDVLQNIARQTYEQIARQEIQGQFASSNVDVGQIVAAPTGGKAAFQVVRSGMLSIFPGDSVLALTSRGVAFAGELGATEVIQNSFVTLTDQAISKRAKYYEQLGLGKQNSQRLASAMENVAISNKFQVAGTRIRWETDAGYEIQINFRNFVAVRDEEASDAVKSRQQLAAVDGFLAYVDARESGGGLL